MASTITWYQERSRFGSCTSEYQSYGFGALIGRDNKEDNLGWVWFSPAGEDCWRCAAGVGHWVWAVSTPDWALPHSYLMSPCIQSAERWHLRWGKHSTSSPVLVYNGVFWCLVTTTGKLRAHFEEFREKRQQMSMWFRNYDANLSKYGGQKLNMRGKCWQSP